MNATGSIFAPAPPPPPYPDSVSFLPSPPPAAKPRVTLEIGIIVFPEAVIGSPTTVLVVAIFSSSPAISLTVSSTPSFSSPFLYIVSHITMIKVLRFLFLI